MLIPNITLDTVIDLARRVWWQDVRTATMHIELQIPSKPPPPPPPSDQMHCSISLDKLASQGASSRVQTCISGWLEAFAAHPRIGDVAGLKQKFGIFAEMSRTEQSVAAAGAEDGIFEVGTRRML